MKVIIDQGGKLLTITLICPNCKEEVKCIAEYSEMDFYANLSKEERLSYLKQRFNHECEKTK